jgi:hypothetical protein
MMHVFVTKKPHPTRNLNHYRLYSKTCLAARKATGVLQADIQDRKPLDAARIETAPSTNMHFDLAFQQTVI